MPQVVLEATVFAFHWHAEMRHATESVGKRRTWILERFGRGLHPFKRGILFSTDSLSPSFDCLGRWAMSNHRPHYLCRAVERADFSRETDRRCCWTSRSANCVASSHFFAPTRRNRCPCRGSLGKEYFASPSGCRSLPRESPNLLLTFFTAIRASQKLMWAHLAGMKWLTLTIARLNS